jgi:hypothetical protein
MFGLHCLCRAAAQATPPDVRQSVHLFVNPRPAGMVLRR